MWGCRRPPSATQKPVVSTRTNPRPRRKRLSLLRPESSRSPARLLQNLLDAVHGLRIGVQTRLLLLAPLLQLVLHADASLLVLRIPVVEGLLRSLLGLEDTEQVL